MADIQTIVNVIVKGDSFTIEATLTIDGIVYSIPASTVFTVSVFKAGGAGTVLFSIASVTEVDAPNGRVDIAATAAESASLDPDNDRNKTTDHLLVVQAVESGGAQHTFDYIKFPARRGIA